MKSRVTIASESLIKYYSSCNDLYTTQIPKFNLVEINRPKSKVGSKISNIQNFHNMLSYPKLLIVHILTGANPTGYG